MSFVNTVDILGDDVLTRSIVDRSIVEFNDNNVEEIDAWAFAYCKNLKTVNLQAVKTINHDSFLSCESLESVVAPLLTSIKGTNNTSGYYGAFYSCLALTELDLPNLKTIGMSAFYNCGLISLNLPSVTSIQSFAFRNCTNLTNVILPSVTSISGHSGTMYYGVFDGCSNLENVELPVVKYMSDYIFKGCSALKNVTAPLITGVGNESFKNCVNLEIIDLYDATKIGWGCFSNCSKLTKVILRNTTQVCTIGATGGAAPFTQTPIANNTGYIYVPAALFSQYFTQYPQYTFRTIEGGIYIVNNNTNKSYLEYNSIKPISMQYIIDTEDENVNASTPTVTVLSDDDTIATISDISVADGVINFNINTLAVTGEINIVVTATVGDFTNSTTLPISVLEEIPEVTYTVEAVDGATYGFELNDNEYYESTNQGINSSYSICKLSFFSNEINNLYLDCISSAESNYDYGIISNIDTTLTSSFQADSANVLKSFKGLASTSVQTVDLGVPELGDHFIYIKFIKDSSGNNGNDSLQFKFRVE